MLHPQGCQCDVLRRAEGGKHAEEGQLAVPGGKAGGEHGGHLARPGREHALAQALLHLLHRLAG